MLTHIMEDLETLGTAPGCGIVSIGMTAFTPEAGLLDEGFYCVVDATRQIREVKLGGYGLHESEDTKEWWQRQSPAAKEAYDKAMSGHAMDLREGLMRRSDYIRRHQPSVCVWGNGADFDNAIMAAIHHALEFGSAQGPFQGRCYRTVKNMAKHVKTVRSGVHHNALDDAKFQAEHLIEIVRRTGFTLA